MTKYLLHGGNADNRSENNDEFYRTIVTSTGDIEVNILCIYFARPEGRWEDSYAEDQSSLFAAGRDTSTEVNTELATYEIDELKKQIQNCDILFINGGRRGHLKDVLLSIPELNEVIRNKVVVGISAGANILTRYYYSSVANAIREGIGLLPIALLCHADRDEGKEILLLKNHGDLPLYKIDEEHFITLNY